MRIANSGSAVRIACGNGRLRIVKFRVVMRVGKVGRCGVDGMGGRSIMDDGKVGVPPPQIFVPFPHDIFYKPTIVYNPTYAKKG